MFEFIASEEDAGQRLDQVVAARVPGLSRRQARVLLDIGGVFVDRARVKVASRRVQAKQHVRVTVGGALARATAATGAAARERDTRTLPEFVVVFEDEHLVVVDKPAGLLVAPTPESDRNNLADILARRRGDREREPVFVVHRIDLPTSGLVVLAKSELANRTLSERFRTHDVDREYLAALCGRLSPDKLSIARPVSGRSATTHLEVTERIGTAVSIVRARLETGRTHQIRIHCQTLGHPVCGDRRYGHRTEHEPPRLALHAALLGFVHPFSREPLRFESGWPEEIRRWLDSFGRGEGTMSANEPAEQDDGRARR